jgi:hypothetical protein
MEKAQGGWYKAFSYEFKIANICRKLRNSKLKGFLILILRECIIGS